MRERPALNRLLVLLAAAPVVLAVADFALAQGNLALHSAIDRRQRAIAEATRLAQVSQGLIRQIALAAVRNHDPKLRDLLGRNGITIAIKSPTSPAGNGPDGNGPKGIGDGK